MAHDAFLARSLCVDVEAFLLLLMSMAGQLERKRNHRHT